MIGIHFGTYSKPKEFLSWLLYCSPLKAYSWRVDEYIPLAYGSGIPEGFYSPSEIQSRIDSLNSDESAEYYCMFGTFERDGVPPAPYTVQEYFSSAYNIALVCTDICLFDLYCKDEDTLSLIQKSLGETDFCNGYEIESITDIETDGRTHFAW